jgi:DNA-binding FadR family transcriptional regulator
LLDRITPASSVDELVDNDLEFHRRVAAAGGNSVLSSLIESLSGPTQRARVWRGLTQEGALQRTLLEHRAILAAMRRRDPELARTWSTVHVAGVEEWLRSTLQS